MNDWQNQLKIDPIPALLSSGDEALVTLARRDLLEETVEPIETLWKMEAALKIVNKQQEDGSWRYPGKGACDAWANYELLETYRQLRMLVEMYGFNRDHPAIQRAAEYTFSCQTEAGDIRGILGNQYTPYYHGAMAELLIKAGYADDARIERGMEWLLSMRQEDGGWLIPMQAVPPKEKTEEMWRGAPIPPDRSRPHAHLATGMVLRAFAAHPTYRRSEEARLAGEQLKSRFFKPDKYNDRKAPSYWTKFQYPFWWANILTALDSLSLMGFAPADTDIEKGIDWFTSNQEEDGLWPSGYGSGSKVARERRWIGLAACRVFKRFYA
ncbi:MAG: prenyltransferase/squalene oxidase repeat-containing protein [Anaerolineae bacterium]|jgi:hypothetical protein